ALRFGDGGFDHVVAGQSADCPNAAPGKRDRENGHERSRVSAAALLRGSTCARSADRPLDIRLRIDAVHDCTGPKLTVAFKVKEPFASFWGSPAGVLAVTRRVSKQAGEAAKTWGTT